MQYVNNIPVWGEIMKKDGQNDPVYDQIQNCLKDEHAAGAALMADHHLGYAVPIGGVVAYEKAISPSGVGFDIACGNKCVRTDANFITVSNNLPRIMDEVWKNISFGIGRKNNKKVDHPLFDDDRWKLLPKELQDLKKMAQDQLGTVGSGNHYVDIFVEDPGNRIWVGCHFGSRGLGHKIATYYLKAGGAKDGMMVDPLVISTEIDLGREYLIAMELAGEYAYAGRDWVCQETVRILNANIVEEIHNHHNFAWKETHMSKEYWVVRKGATPAFPGQKGFVGGSMGDISVILEGKSHPEAVGAFYSTIHGAGRVMGRMEAKGKKGRPGKVTPEMMKAWVDQQGVELRGAGVDESPHCYKRIEDVLDAHQNSINILHTLQPIGVAMAGKDEYDPFKD